MIVYDNEYYKIDKTKLKEDIHNKGTYVALGSFDGLHIGHLELIRKVVTLSKEHNGISMVYTFINHPRKFIKPKQPLHLLSDFNTKVSILKENNVDAAYFEKFDEEFMERSSEEFIKYLCQKFNVKGIVVGFNYKFGYKNLGNTEVLKKLSRKYDFDLYIISPCRFEDEIVSSTRIRKELIEGNVHNACIMLKRPYHLSGVVIKGRQIGRTIGFPTANLSIDRDMVIPRVGVYYTNVIVDNSIYKGITNVGTNPTVNGSILTVETFILDFNEDIYGKKIKVAFIKWLRDQRKFNDIEDLKDQLIEDKKVAINERFYNKL